jgi:hypothetical protein
MGGSIPLPALNVQAPPQQNLMGSMSQLLGMKAQQQEIQQRQVALQNQQAMTAAMKNADPSSPTFYDDLSKGVLQNGGTADAALAIQQHGLTIRKTMSDIAAQDATTGSKNLETFIGKHKAVGDALEGIEQIPDEQLHDAAAQKVAELTKGGVLDPQTAQQSMQVIQSTPDPAQLRQKIDILAKSSLGAMNVATQQKTVAETNQANAKAGLDQAQTWLETNKANIIKAYQQNPQQIMSQVDAIAPPTGPNAALNARTKSQVQFALGNGDVDGAKAAIKQAAEQVGAVEKDVQAATNPAIQNAKVALAARTKLAEQIITQGNPADAGKLLADGSLTLSELKSRGTTPEFIVQATNAAQQANPGFNPQKAEADLGVAKSPANLAFFGSAKSLTDRGGTLDQLADAAKDIPSNRIPVFNSIADVMKASTGSGPIAKYATILLGVADDYSKVMGGGQGSDTSRSQALKLAPTDASPAARAAAIEGIRGAVGSQINSRIGNNAVLQKMYGGSVPAGGGQGGGPPATAQTHSFSLSAWQRANPQGDPNAAKAAAQARGYQVIP